MRVEVRIRQVTHEAVSYFEEPLLTVIVMRDINLTVGLTNVLMPHAIRVMMIVTMRVLTTLGSVVAAVKHTVTTVYDSLVSNGTSSFANY